MFLKETDLFFMIVAFIYQPYDCKWIKSYPIFSETLKSYKAIYKYKKKKWNPVWNYFAVAARNIEEFPIENEKQNNYLYVRTRVGGAMVLGSDHVALQCGYEKIVAKISRQVFGSST